MFYVGVVQSPVYRKIILLSVIEANRTNMSLLGSTEKNYAAQVIARQGGSRQDEHLLTLSPTYTPKVCKIIALNP